MSMLRHAILTVPIDLLGFSISMLKDWAIPSGARVLMRRVFEIDVRECPRCKSQMQTISFITEAQVIREIWASLKMATAPLEVKPSQFVSEQNDFLSEPEYDYSQETWASA